MITVPNEQCLWSSRRVVRIVVLSSSTRRQIKRLFERLVTLAKRLLRHMRQVANFSKRPRNVRLTTRNKDACSNDSLQGLATEKLFFVRSLVQLLGDVADCFGQRELIAPAADIAERSEQVALGARTLRA